MNLSPRTRRIALGLGALLVVVAVAFGTVLVLLVRSAPTSEPAITAYAYGHTRVVRPFEHCAIDLTDCVGGTMTDLPVPVGQSLQLSLPPAIADAPWRLVTAGQRADGSEVREFRQYRSGETVAVTLPSTSELQLNGVEIQLPSAVVDQSGLPIARAVWSIKTA